MERVLILSARQYAFEDEKGKDVAGVQLHYVTADLQELADRRGLEPLTISAPVDVMAQLRDLPGVYQVEFRQRPGKNGRPSLQVVRVGFVQAVDLVSALV